MLLELMESARTASRSSSHTAGNCATLLRLRVHLRRTVPYMRASFCFLLAGATACASAAPPTTTSSTPARDTAQIGVGLGGTSTPNADPFPSTYTPFPSRATVIRNGKILTAAGPMIRNGAILLQNGKIAAVGSTVNAPADALVIDGAGKYGTPGIIDDHSHLGV